MASLVFAGFMGAGKSKAAAAAGEPVDTDRLLEAELGEPIDEFFGREGEEEFRRREEAAVLAALAEAAGRPVALGGGSVLSERVRAALSEQGHVVVWLDVTPEVAWARVEGSGRPLAADRGRFEQLYGERRPLYESVATAIVPARRDAVARALPALEALLHLFPAGTRLAWGESASGDYPAFVGPGLLGTGYGPVSGRRFLVTDTVVGELYGAAVGKVAGELTVAPGEQTKTLAEAERVLRGLATLGATRSDHLIALGGGVVGDLAGFAAAVYQRGIPVVQVPTTLVAQVDSAYGGKTGVDLPEAKNYVGAYHLPAAVLADTATLATLPPGELAAGFAEVLKTGLLAGGSLWERVRSIETLDPAALGDLVFDCARTKLEVVAADERYDGRRAVLNLGHTIGHGIEAASGYSRYRHGEAVGLGLLAVLRLSGAGELRAEVGAILARHGLPVAIDPTIETDAIVAALGRDKKRTAAGVGFVLLERPGEPVTGQVLDPGSVREAIEELRT